VHSAVDVVSPDATPARKDTALALRDHEDALSGSAMQMEETKKLLEETAAGASRLLEMNRRLREELDVARAERDAARAEADQTRARAQATSEVGSASSTSEVAALKTALAEAEGNLRTVSAGFRLLRREREEALNVLKGSEATRAALDEERAAVAKMREALTPPTALKTKTSASSSARDDDDDDDDENDPSTESAARLSRRVSRASRARRATEPGAPFVLPPIGEGDAANEPSAGLSAATGARVSDDEEVHAGSAFGDDDGPEEPFSFAPRSVAGAASRRTRIGSARASDLAPPLLASTGSLLARRPESAPPSERMLTNSAARRGEPVAEDAAARRLRALGDAEGAARPTTARGGRAGSLGEITLRGLGATLPPKHAVSDESEIETNDDDDGVVSEVSVSDSEGSVEDDARATLGSRARVERKRRDPRLDPIRRSSQEKKAGRGERVVRPEPGSRRIGAGSFVASRGSSRAATPAASPAKPHARNPRRGHGREEREREHEREREREDKPAFRPAGIATATRAVPELLTGATLAFAAQRLAAADARFVRWAEGAPGRLDAGASGVSARRKYSRGGGKNARRRAQ